MRPPRTWLIHLFFVFMLLMTAACNYATDPPATLQVRISTPIPTPSPVIQPTATTPVGLGLKRPVDPSVSALLNEVQNDRLMFAVGSLVRMETRHVLSAKDSPAKGIGAARDWLLEQFNALRDSHPEKKIDVWTQPVQFTWRTSEVKVENIVAVFQGTDIGAGVIVIGAHYDSISSDPYNGDAPAPGADDNASGVAAMLEIAHIMAPLPHRATLIFVAFTAEETGRQGSLAFVNDYLQAQNPPIAVQAMINLDSIGNDRDQNNRVDQRTLRLFSADPNDSASRQLARQLALIISIYATDINPALQSAEERTGRWGDQQSFSAGGYPSMHFIQGLEDPSRQHSPRDTLDNIQLDYLIRATRAVLSGVIILADGLRPPASLTLRQNAAGTQTLVWTPVQGAAGYLIALRQTSSLFYDQVLTLASAGQHQLEWDQFARYATIAVCAYDGAGRIGPFSAEVPITALLRR
jgi:hypothetical protein